MIGIRLPDAWDRTLNAGSFERQKSRMPCSFNGADEHTLAFRTIACGPSRNNFAFFRQVTPQGFHFFEIQIKNFVRTKTANFPARKRFAVFFHHRFAGSGTAAAAATTTARA